MEPNLASLRLERLERELEKPDGIASGPLSLRALSGQRDKGRFVARHTTHELLDGIAEVARAASTKPKTVSTRIWNEARLLAGREDLPTASAAYRRLGVPWPLVLELAFTAAAKRSRVLGTRVQQPDFRGDDETILSGLRLVAHRVQAPLDRITYDLERLKVDAERVRRGRAPLNLPHSQTVIKRLRSWADACRRAGIEPARAVPPPLHRARPAVELLDEFVSKHRLLPYRSWFEQWSRAMDIPLGRDARRWEVLVEALRERRAARGEETPFEAASRSSLPPIPDSQPVGRNRRRRAKRHGREEARASLRLYKKRHLRPGDEPRQKHYMAAARKDRELLSASVLERHGRFQDLCREAGL
jgi:hypothetical protein